MRQEQHAHGERLTGTQKHAGLAQQILRDSGLDAAVAALAVSSNGTAMREAAEAVRVVKDFVFGTAVQGRNEADSAFVLRAQVE
jgi:hypothetical protein